MFVPYEKLPNKEGLCAICVHEEIGINSDLCVTCSITLQFGFIAVLEIEFVPKILRTTPNDWARCTDRYFFVSWAEFMEIFKCGIRELAPGTLISEDEEIHRYVFVEKEFFETLYEARLH